MYEYKHAYAGLGQIHGTNVGIVGNGIAVSPALPPTPVMGVENCSMGCCGSYAMGTGETSVPASRPWWHYALAGAGIVGVVMMAKRTFITKNPKDELTPDEVIRQAAAITIQAGIPTLLWGPPGIGKTQWIKSLGKAMAPMNGGEPVEVFTVIGSTKDPTDIGGIPLITGTSKPPFWAAQIEARSKAGLRSILFLDEFSSMSPMIHAAFLRVINEKVAGDTNFDPDPRNQLVHVVAAANSKKHGAGSIEVPPPAANRFIHFEWPKPTNLEWAAGMMTGWTLVNPFFFKLPKNWRKSPGFMEAREKIGMFIKFRETGGRTSVLHLMPALGDLDDEGNKKVGRAWPSPRSWEMAADALAACFASKVPVAVQLSAVEGAVGSAAAGELFSFSKIKDLPDPDSILADPTGWVVPSETVKLYIISNTLVNAVRRKMTLERYQAAWDAVVYAVDVTGDAPSLTPAVRDLAVMKADDRYREMLTEFNQPASAKHFVEALKGMKLISASTTAKGKATARAKKKTKLI